MPGQKIFQKCVFFSILNCWAGVSLANPQVPIFAAELSDNISQYCETNNCLTHHLDNQTLTNIIAEHPESLSLQEALNLSEYEILVGSVVLDVDTNPEVVLEITTSWRGIPIDEINLSQKLNNAPDNQMVYEASAQVLANWVEHIQHFHVLDAELIYKTIGASNYEQELSLPSRIGDFELEQRALYRDPLQGSIARYTHPKFANAIVDISVYPVSPFTHATDVPDTDLMAAELDVEKQQLLALVNQAGITDYEISDIKLTQLGTAEQSLQGVILEVKLESDVEPVYSTQYLFKKGDKFVKLTGNFPNLLMQSVVEQSIAAIQVPPESEFMRSMRKG
ncbi:hypothetical protein [Glaciecola sp. 1036]|uniref:hypothetical protein n=1 Tax=Alteromonadaceae TaxID=72275 RepID=UPI003D0141A1